MLANAAVLLVQLETPLETVETAVELAVASGVRVILNPAPARPLPARLLKHIYLLTPNESEAELLTGIAVNDEATAAGPPTSSFAAGSRTSLSPWAPRRLGGRRRSGATGGRIQGEGG